jgi:hypothetical protein
MEGFLVRTVFAFVIRSLAPAFQVSVSGQCVKRCVKDKFHDALGDIIDEREPRNRVSLFMK